jgi:hypothetical protein
VGSAADAKVAAAGSVGFDAAAFDVGGDEVVAVAAPDFHE